MNSYDKPTNSDLPDIPNFSNQYLTAFPKAFLQISL